MPLMDRNMRVVRRAKWVDFESGRCKEGGGNVELQDDERYDSLVLEGG